MKSSTRIPVITLALVFAAASVGAVVAPGTPGAAPGLAPDAAAHSGHDPSLRLVSGHRRKALRVRVTLNSAGSRYVGTRVPIRGYLSGNTRGVRKRIVVQRKVNGAWRKSGQKFQRRLGGYRLPAQRITRTGRTQFRTVTFARGKRLRVSNVIQVRGVARPRTVTQERTIDGATTCEHLTVAVLDQERSSSLTWNQRTKEWVVSWSRWTAVSARTRQAQAADCINVVTRTSSDVLLPDIRIRNLDRCGKGDRDRSGGSCFFIVNSAPTIHGFPHLAGRKLLKFPVITLNVGDGPSELVADRSSPSSTTWRAYQTFLRPNGQRESVVMRGAEFYYAGDGHDHWHVKDFDDYELLDSDGTTMRTAEKHGYCLQDNTTYPPMAGRPGVPESIVYSDATQCAKGLPDTLAMIHGMSRGWGDTYPSSLPDQALDITGVPDGEYVVRVVADARDLIREKDETNNTASIRVRIAGDKVSVVPGSATGGLP
ncbi:MAG: lysyl oxidase family protein [Nocardioides sp.]|nr:lysyl oxidase family protein [Nocardioides sp.]